MGPCVLSRPQPEDMDEGEPDVLFIKEESSEEDQEGKRRGLSVQEGEWGGKNPATSTISLADVV